MPSSSPWQRFQQYFLEYRGLGFSLDISQMKFPGERFEKMRPQIEHAFAAMRQPEAGAIANPTEKRMAGRYRLKSPALAPTREIRPDIDETIGHIKAFVENIHSGKISAEERSRFRRQLHIVLRHLASDGPRINVATGDEHTDDRFSLGPSK